MILYYDSAVLYGPKLQDHTYLHTYLIIFIHVGSQRSCHRNRKMPFPFNPCRAVLRVGKVKISGVILLLLVTITLLLTNEWNPGEVWFVHVKINRDITWPRGDTKFLFE